MNYRMVCSHCGRTAEVSALGTAEVSQGITPVVGQDGKVSASGFGRIELDNYGMDVDMYQCDLCEAQEFLLDKLVRVIHPWSPEWMEGGDGKANKEKAEAGPEQDT